jgi:hypothetical protein
MLFLRFNLHVWGDELVFPVSSCKNSYGEKHTHHPLRKFLGLEVAVELGQVLVLGQSLSTGVGIVDHSRVVLSDVVVGLALLVDPSLSLETRVWHVFLVLRPCNTLVL